MTVINFSFFSVLPVRNVLTFHSLERNGKEEAGADINVLSSDFFLYVKLVFWLRIFIT